MQAEILQARLPQVPYRGIKSALGAQPPEVGLIGRSLADGKYK